MDRSSSMDLFSPQLQVADPVDKASLGIAFEWQQQQIRKIVQDELDKRFPPSPPSGTTSSSSKQSSGTLWSLLSSSENRRNPKDQHTIDMLHARINELRREVESSNASLAKLRKENSYWIASHSSSKEFHENTRHELAQERLKSAELERKTADLRSMLIPASETQLSDSEVIAKFSLLQSHILRFVKTVTRSHDFKKARVMETTEEQTRILSPFASGKINMRYLDDRLRGVVFSILDDQIFSVRHYSLGQKDTRLGNILCKAESYLREKLPKDSHDSILDWRMASMKATEAFRDNGYSVARAAYRAVDNFFKVFEPRSEGTEGDHTQLLEKICMDAEHLSLIMRTAKDEYRVEMLACALDRPIAEYCHFSEDEAYYPSVSEVEQPDTIAYFICGVLVKLPYGNVEDVKVLEKAKAVIYSQPEKKA